MSKNYVILVSLLMVALLAACVPGEGRSVTGSGNVMTREMDLSGFDKVDASNTFQVEIRQGEDFEVLIRFDDNVEEFLDVGKQGSTLKLGLKPSPNLTLRNVTLEAEVTMPTLVGLEVSGAGQASISGFSSPEDFYAEVSGASTMRGDITAGNVRIEASGASHATLSGSGNDLTVNASGASTVDLEDFTVDNARVRASGASQVTVKTDGTLDADASGASRVYYDGNPTMGDIETSGASSIARK